MIPDYPCKRDSHKHHYWVLLGVIENNNIVYKIFECSQCKEAVWDEVNFIYQKDKIRGL